MKHTKQLKLLARQPTPFYVVFHERDPMAHKALLAHQCRRITHWWWIETAMNHGPFNSEEQWMVKTMVTFMKSVLGLESH